MIGTSESAALIGLLSDEARPLEDLAAAFDSHFPGDSRFPACCSLATLLQALTHPLIFISSTISISYSTSPNSASSC